MVISQVQPFAGIIDTVRFQIPRVLFNRDVVGPFRYSRRTNDLVSTGTYGTLILFIFVVCFYFMMMQAGPVALSNRCPTGVQEVAGLILQSGNILSWRLVMKSFLWPFSPYC